MTALPKPNFNNGNQPERKFDKKPFVKPKTQAAATHTQKPNSARPGGNKSFRNKSNAKRAVDASLGQKVKSFIKRLFS